jgi:hypothetical protein
LGRKGWLPAFRDATLFKVAYGYGLRRNETRMLDLADFGRNPHAPEFGGRGVCYVRYGKATKGSPPKRHSVLTVWPWTAEVNRSHSPGTSSTATGTTPLRHQKNRLINYGYLVAVSWVVVPCR